MIEQLWWAPGVQPASNHVTSQNLPVPEENPGFWKL